MPWHTAGSHFAPLNATTGNYYQGFNILALYVAGTDNNYPTPKWATYNQWQDADAQVRRGEKQTRIVKWVPVKKKDSEDETILLPKVYGVFNAAQVDGAHQDDDAPRTKVDTLANVEDYIANTNAAIERGGPRAFYRPSEDKIYLPAVDDFHSTEANYAVTLHELTHWTGAPHRLNRQLGHDRNSNEYAFEELVAELGAAMLCARLNISAQPRDDHASYIANWLTALKNDPKHIVTAASHARKAIEHIDQLQPANQPEPIAA